MSFRKHASPNQEQNQILTPKEDSASFLQHATRTANFNEETDFIYGPVF